MPFTLAHPAAVLPLQRVGLPLSALVAGAMAPDLPMFLPERFGYASTHSLLGILSYDVGIALIGLWLWFTLVRDPFADLTPCVRERVLPSARLTSRQWILAPVAAAVGAATHVGWDLFTHERRWGTQHIGVLRESWGPMMGYQWAQFASGLVGGAVLIGYTLQWLSRRPIVPRAPVRLGWFLVAPTLAVCAGLVALFRADGLHKGAADAAVGAIQTGTLAALAVSVVWWLRWGTTEA